MANSDFIETDFEKLSRKTNDALMAKAWQDRAFAKEEDSAANSAEKQFRPMHKRFLSAKT